MTRSSTRSRPGGPDADDPRSGPPAADASSTRRRLVDAAVDCILEEGYYRASSNRIARRAGVTWGVIQHHFGTRERLLLAVVSDRLDTLVTTLAGARVQGSTSAERLESLADAIWAYYRRPEFLAGVQIVMNLSRDPEAAEETVTTLVALGDRISAEWQRMVDQVLDPARQPPGLSRSLFRILRGAAVGGELLDSMTPSRARSDDRADREVLLRALTLLVDEVGLVDGVGAE